MKFPRASGVLLHPTSLPSRFGIGDLGDAAFRFIDFLASAGQTYWQILPLAPTGYGDSPYQGLSAFAGNPLLISPEKLIARAHLSADDLRDAPVFPNERVEFGAVIPYKNALLDRAFANFRARGAADERAAFARFCAQERAWLDDFALFMALKTEQNAAWYEWEKPIASRQPPALAKAGRARAEEIENQKYRQWIFFEQWRALKAYVNARGIRVIGDLPIFVARDSADVWAHPEYFWFDENLSPTHVSGVPPDAFSATGQLWGHPLYRWDVMQRDGFAWWLARFRSAFEIADVIRMDHFRGLHNYWRVPAGEKTAVRGEWVRAPGRELLRALNAARGDAAMIAEDLGSFDAASRAGVDALMAEFEIPRMAVLQFAFDGDARNPFLPHHVSRESAIYTGTHDNATSAAWYAAASEAERDQARRVLQSDGADIAWDLIRAAWGSRAQTAIAPAQDLLSLGKEARMNFPSTTGAPNWCWRVLPGALNDALAARVKELTRANGRNGEPPSAEIASRKPLAMT